MCTSCMGKHIQANIHTYEKRWGKKEEEDLANRMVEV